MRDLRLEQYLDLSPSGEPITSGEKLYFCVYHKACSFCNGATAVSSLHTESGKVDHGDEGIQLDLTSETGGRKWTTL